MSSGMGKGFWKVDSPDHGGGMGEGAASGGNWRTALDGQSPGCREGPAPDMVGVAAGDDARVEVQVMAALNGRVVSEVKVLARQAQTGCGRGRGSGGRWGFSVVR